MHGPPRRIDNSTRYLHQTAPTRGPDTKVDTMRYSNAPEYLLAEAADRGATDEGWYGDVNPVDEHVRALTMAADELTDGGL